MDPDEALALIRAACIDIRSLTEQGYPVAAGSRATELAEYFEGLDGWISSGGFLPKEWAKDA